MNIMKLFAVRDRCTGFASPMMEINEDVAKRNFAYACSSGQMLAQVKDFDLYYLGDYDTANGFFIADKLPQLVITGADASLLYKE